MVFQGPSLLPPLTVVENVALPLVLDDATDAQARRLAHEALERLGLDDIAPKLPEEISGGQAQRVAVARALAGRPLLILADEPTGQLDRVNATEVIDVLLATAGHLGGGSGRGHPRSARGGTPARAMGDARWRAVDTGRRGAGMIALTWLRGLVAHRASRVLSTALGVGVGVALLASIGTFLSSTTSKMTQRAIARVPVDWQVEGQNGTSPAALLTRVRTQPGVTRALPVSFADTPALRATSGGSTQTTGSGKVLGLPAGYATAFPGELRVLSGSETGALLAQQTAANLHAQPGDTITIARSGGARATVRVAGVVDLPAADSLFQKVGAPAGAQPQAPPDNVVLLPQATFARVEAEPP